MWRLIAHTGSIPAHNVLSAIKWLTARVPSLEPAVGDRLVACKLDEQHVRAGVKVGVQDVDERAAQLAQLVVRVPREHLARPVTAHIRAISQRNERE